MPGRAIRTASAALIALVLCACASFQARASDGYASGEVVEIRPRPGAALRDADGRDIQRVTLWYPASAEAAETPRLIGPVEAPYFISGQAAEDAVYATGARRPLIVMSHGFGGSARQMAWLGSALARAGFIVAAVDHPGNNGADDRTPEGALLYWERSDDLRQALDSLLADPVWGPRIDEERIGAVGYSMGGASVLIQLGARPDPARIANHCLDRPGDALCSPVIVDGDFGSVEREAVLTASPAVRASVAGLADDRRDPRIRAAILIAPALVAAFSDESTASIVAHVLIVQGADDAVTSFADNGGRLADLLVDDEVLLLAGAGHNDFLGLCAEAGRDRYGGLCEGAASREAVHQQAAEAAVAFLRQVLAPR